MSSFYEKVNYNKTKTKKFEKKKKKNPLFELK